MYNLAGTSIAISLMIHKQVQPCRCRHEHLVSTDLMMETADYNTRFFDQ